MEKTPLIKSFIGVLIVFLLFDLFAVFDILRNISNLFKSALLASPAVNVILALGILIGFVLSIIMIVKLFKMSADLSLWIHITFGFGIFDLILYFILPNFVPGGRIPLILYPLGNFFAMILQQYKFEFVIGFYLVLLLLSWFFISRHVKKHSTP
jgi:hypothetical protein